MGQIGFFEWQAYAESLAFMGNSLLGTMRRTPKVGLRKNFWSKFPTFGSEEVAAACTAMEEYVAHLGEVEDAVTEISVEYTRLFVGPPKPAAPPWETFYQDGESEVGFGRPTFEMREALRNAGLELKNVNNQYEDHAGIELLFLSVLCTRIAQGEVPDAVPAEPKDVQDFLEAHLLTWIDKFQAAVAAEASGAYYDHLLRVCTALLHTMHAELTS